MKFCNVCGGSINRLIPQGDNRERYVCSDEACGEIHYQNPRIITGCLPIYKEQILLCRRAIEPRLGLWTLPAGFLENQETTQQGAERESLEEANANLDIKELYTIFDIPHINQVYFFYRAELLDTDFSPGIESLDVKLFKKEDIPWDELAFPAIKKTLEYYIEDSAKQQFKFRSAILEPSIAR
jgi:ADP-ribose pyrophosphatase YjhB (NUDIX family)